MAWSDSDRTGDTGHSDHSDDDRPDGVHGRVADYYDDNGPPTAPFDVAALHDRLRSGDATDDEIRSHVDLIATLERLHALTDKLYRDFAVVIDYAAGRAKHNDDDRCAEHNHDDFAGPYYDDYDGTLGDDLDLRDR